jgi:hypothetical protein
MGKPSAIRPAHESLTRYGINFLLYGDPGCGKTPLIAERPKTLIIDSDEGAESAAHTNAEVWPATTWPDMDEVYEYLRHEDHGYEWVWWDGVSIGQDALLEDTMRDLIDNRGKKHRVPYLIDVGEYGENMNRIKQWVRHMKSQPFNFGITAHPFYWSTDVGEEKMWPWIQGRNMPQTICGHMNVIGRMMVDKEGKNRVYFKETDVYYAKDRFGALGAGLINPSIAGIERKIKEKISAGKSGSSKGRATTTRRKANRV